MTPEEALARANEAARLLDAPLLKEALASIETDIVEAWLTCPVRDTEGRETLWRMAVSARKLRDILRGTMESGRLAKDQIVQKKTFMDRAKSVANWRQ